MQVAFSLLANGVIVERDNPAEITLANYPYQWIDLGLWTLTEEAAVSVRMTVPYGQRDGQIGVDVVALVRRGSE